MKAYLTSLFILVVASLNAQNSFSKVLPIKTFINAGNSSLRLQWNKISTATGYSISKKLRHDSAWTIIDTLPTANDTSYVDNTVNPTTGYEYQILTLGSGITASGCVYAAIDMPPNHYVGRLILLIDSAYIDYSKLEINQYLIDIIKEGWNYNLRFVSRSSSVTAIKQIVKTMFDQDPVNTKGVFILGHLKIPYSGIIYPDGHPDHEGAWPADCYYADTSFEAWSDTSVNIVTATRPQNKNIPGDGKFDQWSVSHGSVKLFVTRVDLFDMPGINTNDSLLTRNYLIKDHAYRNLQNQFRMRALVDDNFGYFGGEAFGQNGYRNGANLLGRDSVIDGDYFTSMNTTANSYLWSYGCGSGTYTSAGGIGNTANFQSSTVKSVFTMLFGSYFGDWDNTNNFLRAPLASSCSVLTSCWAGRPNWSFHAMGLGECIGFTAYAQLKTPGIYYPSNYGSNFIHVELLGDPTLKMYLYAPPQNLLLSQGATNNIVVLSWNASTDTTVTGYFIYRTNSLSNRFTLLNTTPITTINFTDNTASPGKNIYMVRAVKSQKTVASGTFKNLSNGIIDSISLSTPLPVKLINFTLIQKDCDIQLFWNVANEQQVHNYEILFSADGIHFNSLVKMNATNASNYSTIHKQICLSFDDQTLYYKLKITDADGRVSFSNVLFYKIEAGQHLLIYENPAKDLLTINGLKKNGIIKIISLNGKTLCNQVVYQDIVKMGISFLPPGVYFLQYFFNGNMTTLKFVKQ